MSAHPVWLEGHGFLDSEGRYFPESRVRAALAYVAAFAEAWEQLPEEIRAQIRRAAEDAQ